MKPANNAPIYASIYHELAEVCRKHGYALAIHGSLAKDFDLIAIPWTDAPASPQSVIAEIESQFALKATGPLATNPHGRYCQTMVFAGGDAFLDLSFMSLSIDYTLARCNEMKHEIAELAKVVDDARGSL